MQIWKYAGRLLCIYAGIQVCKDAGKKYKIIQVLKYTTMIVWNYESVQMYAIMQISRYVCIEKYSCK